MTIQQWRIFKPLIRVTPLHSPANTAMPVASSALRDALRDVTTARISGVLRRHNGITGLQRFHRGAKLVGPAVTVKARPGDNLLIYKALRQMAPGHVLVVDGAGDLTITLDGELFILYAQRCGCVGLVLDGALRETAAFHEADFPCWARGVSNRGSFKQEPGAVNVPIVICGQVVNPGDLVVGDEDAVVLFPPSDASRQVSAVAQTERLEAAIRTGAMTGQLGQP